jgi:hypothetical protein
VSDWIRAAPGEVGIADRIEYLLQAAHC